MKYYAIADIHGRYDLLSKAVKAIHEDADEGEYFTVVTLGDYIDRGPESKQVLEYLIEYSKAPGVVCLQGNHESMAVETITKPLSCNWWMSNGGYQTLTSYHLDAMPWETGWMLPEHVKWIGGLPHYFETEKHVFVHAGVPADDLDLKDQSKEDMQWMLYSKTDNGGFRGKHVVHGHHQFADGPHEWVGRTDLDCFAWNTGRLVVGVFDDSQAKALRYLEVFGDDYKVPYFDDPSLSIQGPEVDQSLVVQ